MDKKGYSLQITIVSFNTAYMLFANMGLANESLKCNKTSREWRDLGRNCNNKKKSYHVILQTQQLHGTLFLKSTIKKKGFF